MHFRIVAFPKVLRTCTCDLSSAVYEQFCKEFYSVLSCETCSFESTVHLIINVYIVLNFV